jgi:hypothetical protein
MSAQQIRLICLSFDLCPMSHSLRPVLPGEVPPPSAPSHGAAAPELPFIVETYGGCRSGWQPIASRRDAQSAVRFSALLGRVRPTFLHRITLG